MIGREPQLNHHITPNRTRRRQQSRDSVAGERGTQENRNEPKTGETQKTRPLKKTRRTTKTVKRSPFGLPPSVSPPIWRDDKRENERILTSRRGGDHGFGQFILHDLRRQIALAGLQGTKGRPG